MIDDHDEAKPETSKDMPKARLLNLKGVAFFIALFDRVLPFTTIVGNQRAGGLVLCPPFSGTCWEGGGVGRVFQETPSGPLAQNAGR